MNILQIYFIWFHFVWEDEKTNFVWSFLFSAWILAVFVISFSPLSCWSWMTNAIVCLMHYSLKYTRASHTEPHIHKPKHTPKRQTSTHTHTHTVVGQISNSTHSEFPFIKYTFHFVNFSIFGNRKTCIFCAICILPWLSLLMIRFLRIVISWRISLHILATPYPIDASEIDPFIHILAVSCTTNIHHTDTHTYTRSYAGTMYARTHISQLNFNSQKKNWFTRFFSLSFFFFFFFFAFAFGNFCIVETKNSIDAFL